MLAFQRLQSLSLQTISEISCILCYLLLF
jgi:hypothetical protein